MNIHIYIYTYVYTHTDIHKGSSHPHRIIEEERALEEASLVWETIL